MNIRSTIFFCAALVLPLILCGCGGGTQKDAQKPKRKPKVTHLEPGTCDYEQTKNGVTVRAKLLKTEQECIDAFGKNGKYLLNIRKEKHKIYPIKLTVKNHRNTELILSEAKIKLAPAKKVFAKLGSNNWLKVCGLGAGIVTGSMAAVGLAESGLGLMILSGVGSAAAVFTLTGIILAAGTVPLVAAPFAMAAYRLELNKQNKKLKNKIAPSPSIKPSETQTFFLFVRQPDYKPNFELTFTNENQKKLSFDLQLPAL